MYMLLLVARPTYLEHLSIVISIATTAFTIASIDFNLDTDPKLRLAEPRFFGLVPDKSGDRALIFAAMFLNSFAQMAALVISTASLAHFDPKIAMCAWCGRFAMMCAFKLARRELSHHVPIRGLPGIVLAAFERPAVMFLCDVGLFSYGRRPYEMGCVQWWFGRLWPWLLLVSAIVLRATAPAQLASSALNTTTALAELLGANTSAIPAANTTGAILNTTSSGNGTLNATAFAGDYAQSALTDPLVLSAVAAVLFVVWLVTLIAFFLLAKREYWPSFWNNETAAEYTKRVKWDGQPNERLRAMLLVKVHPSLLRLIAPEARTWIGKNWKRWTKDKPDWFTDRWKRGLPDSVLSQQALAELGGKNRRRSSLSEQLGVANAVTARTAAVIGPGPAAVVTPARLNAVAAH
jgi:preprotein translocase subunit SecG